MWLSPRTLIREIYEITTFAKELAKAFPNTESVEFRCSWHGLKDRQIADFEMGFYREPRTSHVSDRNTAGIFSIEKLTADTATVVAALGGPALTLFGGLEATPEWIESLRPGFRTM